jgi:hypothetical protein
VEHEFTVRDAAGGVVDFRILVDDPDLGRRLDPAIRKHTARHRAASSPPTGTKPRWISRLIGTAPTAAL